MSHVTVALFVIAGSATACIPDDAPGMADTAEIEGALGAAEYGPATWKASPNFYNKSRKIGDVTVVVIHTTQGSFAGSVSWMQNPKSNVSAHYIISKTGQVVQMVKEEDVAWHVGSENGYTIGIEHEGFVSDPNWVTPQMLDASSKLTCYLVKKWKLAPTKAHIKGHVEMPNQTHTDPGKYWPWDKYIGMVAGCVNGVPPPPVTCPGGCDDKNPCTTDVCQAGKCVHTNNTATCNDNVACTTADKCGAGKCAGVPKVCNDNNPCTDDSCTAATGACAAKDNAKPCTLGPCVTGAMCSLGKCGGGTKAACDDKNACTDDSCDAKTGKCAHANNSVACDDGSACTTGDKCGGGACKPGLAKACDDGNPCTTDGCKAGVCLAMPKNGACDDGDSCTTGDTCATGSCTGSVKLCSDGNACTIDACTNGACTFTQMGGACDDGDSCTENDTCLNGACGGNMMACDDGKACSVDSCSNGVCAHTACPGPSGGGDASAGTPDATTSNAPDAADVTAQPDAVDTASRAPDTGTAPNAKDATAAPEVVARKTETVGADSKGNGSFGQSDEIIEPPSPFFVPKPTPSSGCAATPQGADRWLAMLALLACAVVARRRQVQP